MHPHFAHALADAQRADLRHPRPTARKRRRAFPSAMKPLAAMLATGIQQPRICYWNHCSAVLIAWSRSNCNRSRAPGPASPHSPKEGQMLHPTLRAALADAYTTDVRRRQTRIRPALPTHSKEESYADTNATSAWRARGSTRTPGPPTTDAHAQPSRLQLLRVALGLLAGAMALALLLGYTTQAYASPGSPFDSVKLPGGGTTQNNCTVTPKKPEILPDLDTQGRKQARFPISIVCTKDRTVYIGGPGDNRQRAYEQDNGKPGDVGGNDLIASWYWTWNFGVTGGSKVIAPVYHVPNYDVDPWVELFHQVSFRACSADGACGSFTPYEASPVLSGVHI